MVAVFAHRAHQARALVRRRIFPSIVLLGLAATQRQEQSCKSASSKSLGLLQPALKAIACGIRDSSSALGTAVLDQHLAWSNGSIHSWLRLYPLMSVERAF